MASEIDICNLALSHIGDVASVSAITPPDGSVQSEHCARFYPIARDMVVESHNWNFALRRAPLSLLATTGLPHGWSFQYAHPNCLKVVAVYPADTDSATPSGTIFEGAEFAARMGRMFPFTIESLTTGARVIYSNVEDATVLYVARITDTTRFGPHVVNAMSRLLASFVAGPIIKGEKGTKVAEKQLAIYEQVALPKAQRLDATQGHDESYENFTPSNIAARN